MISFFERQGSRDNIQDDVEFRSRSISSASNTSFPGYLRKGVGYKKYFNLAALDGFAMIERNHEEEDKYNLNETVLKGMDVDGI